MKGILTGAAMLALAALPLVPPAHVAACEASAVIVSTDCIEAEAFDIQSSGLGVSVGGIRVATGGEPCSRLTGIRLTTYRDKDGVEGYKNPPDQFVGHRLAEQTDPSHSIEMGSFSTHDPANGTADSWQLVITDENSRRTTFSGDF